MAAGALGWSDEIEGQGGAILVANGDDFPHWQGVTGTIGHDALQSFGAGRSAYLWNALPGAVRLAVNGARDALVLVQVEYADKEADRAAACAFALADAGALLATRLHFRVTRGPVLVAWAASRAADSSTALASLPLTATSPGALIDFADGASAAALWLQSGLYASALYFHEEDRWGVSWCRLQRVAP